jgi:hypothetical protein
MRLLDMAAQAIELQIRFAFARKRRQRIVGPEIANGVNESIGRLNDFRCPVDRSGNASLGLFHRAKQEDKTS